jgi:beta-glucosidase-like glycosyl hydrolase/CubicO group peptidase (beta-lactamase class C family)
LNNEFPDFFFDKQDDKYFNCRNNHFHPKGLIHYFCPYFINCLFDHLFLNKFMKYKSAIVTIFILLILPAFMLSFQSPDKKQENTTQKAKNSPDLYSPWVDSVFKSLSQEEKIAQLLMIRTYSNQDRAFYDSISRLIMDYNLGGLCFFQGDPGQQSKLTNMWQRLAKTPLLIAMDAEWGVGMRLDSAFSFPKQMTMGAMQDNELVYLAGKQIGKNCRRIGVHINFAPVVDINSNPKNPVINFRSFGEDKKNVADKGVAYIQGLQSEGVIATAKHFPGHGDTDSDSHFTLPLLNHDKALIDSVDLYPFKKAIDAGVGGIMVAHLFIPELDNRKNIATSISEKTVDSLLRKELGFKGLAITDALDMQGVTRYHKPGDIELKALLAGNDILLLPLDIPGAISKIKKAINDSLITQDEVDFRCRKILAYKQLMGLDNLKEIEEEGIVEEINNPINELISRKIMEESVTIVKNHNNLIPLQILDTIKAASLVIGRKETSVFQETLDLYAGFNHYNVSATPGQAEIDNTVKTLNNYNLVIIAIEKTSNYASRKYGISDEAIDLISKVNDLPSKLIIDIFGNPYALSRFDGHQIPDALVVSYEDTDRARDISAQLLFGAIGAEGRLPVSATDKFPAGTGITTQPLGRLKYSIPEEVGIPRDKLDTITKLVEYGIHEKAYPGAQVVLAKDGIVFYNHSFGYHTYDSVQKVNNNDVYDLASLTKISATTLAVMDLYEEGKFDIDMPLSWYLPYLRNSNKRAKITREILAHQAQFQPWIPFYWKTKVDNQLNPEIYSKKTKKHFQTQVADELFILNSYRDSIFDTIVSSELREKREYKYSDIGYYLLWDAMEKITGQPFDEYVTEKYYKPMGLPSMRYNPLKYFHKGRIVPTELDTSFRKQLVHGYVHDPGAAMLGGVCGHAGLFSNANDQAKLMQMYLQGGYYGGHQYLRSETIEEFTRLQFPLDENRRGIGFDKPYPEYDSLGPVCEGASLRSYGHSGFTGTYTWADPENGLVYVFLSNRVYPDANNYKLLKMDLRTDLHQLVYDILNEQKPFTLRKKDGIEVN